MSYSIVVRVADGTPVIDSSSGIVPDGVLAVNGHEDRSQVTIGVTRRNADGTTIAYASAQATSAAFPVEVTP